MKFTIILTRRALRHWITGKPLGERHSCEYAYAERVSYPTWIPFLFLTDGWG